jgi:hypothetical protein
MGSDTVDKIYEDKAKKIEILLIYYGVDGK